MPLISLSGPWKPSVGMKPMLCGTAVTTTVNRRVWVSEWPVRVGGGIRVGVVGERSVDAARQRALTKVLGLPAAGQ